MLHLAAFCLVAGLLWYFLPTRTVETKNREEEGFLFRVVAHPDCPIIVEPAQEAVIENNK